GNKYGDVTLVDGLAKDGLTDVYKNYAMGNAAELCAKECNISREAQDAFAIESYKRSQNAWETGKFNDEIVPVEIGIKPLAIIRSYADAEQAPEWFTTTPSLAVPKAVNKAGLQMNDIDFVELNEAFSVVGIANIQ